MTQTATRVCRAWPGWLMAGAMALCVPASPAAELLVGEARAGDEPPVVFRISGESRDNVVGGAITLGESRFTIQRVSRRGLIGGARQSEADGAGFAEYAVFSSSFSEQTAIGNPWVAAQRYHHCDEPYNSFLAVYRINDPAAVKKLGPVPYPTLVDDLERSDDAMVYCFVSARGAGG